MNDPITRKVSLVLVCWASLSVLAACGEEKADAAAPEQDRLQQTTEKVARALPNSAAPLQPNQREQGYIEADTGGGTLRYRALATKMADDLGEQAAAKLNTADGRRAVQGSGVAATQVQELADHFAGKTVYEADLRHVPIIKRYTVSLQGNARDGSQLRVDLQLSEHDFALLDASVSYLPEGLKKPFESYSSTEGTAAQVSIDRFEKVDDTTFRIAGTFLAENLGASTLAKALKGKTLARAEGRFEFAELPLKEMPKFGVQR